MKQYKGYYLDGVVFTTKDDVDNFLKTATIEKMKIFSEMFASDRYTAKEKMQISHEITKRERRLHDEYGMEWEEIEALQF